MNQRERFGGRRGALLRVSRLNCHVDVQEMRLVKWAVRGWDERSSGLVAMLVSQQRTAGCRPITLCRRESSSATSISGAQKRPFFWSRWCAQVLSLLVSLCCTGTQLLVSNMGVRRRAARASAGQLSCWLQPRHLWGSGASTVLPLPRNPYLLSLFLQELI